MQSVNISSFIGLELEKDLQIHTRTIIEQIEQDMREHPDMMFLLPKEEILPETITESHSEFPDITTEIALFVPLGESRDYMDRGMVGRIRYNYVWDNPSMNFALGWMLSINKVSARGVMNSADNFFISSGLDIHLKYHIHQRLFLSIGAAGGICVWSINLENQGYQGAVIPMAASDLGIGLDISDKVGLFVSAEYSIYFEESFILWVFLLHWGCI